MKYFLSIISFSAACTLHVTNASALSCDHPAETPILADLSNDEAAQIRLRALVDRLTPEVSEFVVFGEFYQVQDLPFMHIRDHEDRLARWIGQDLLFEEIQGSVEYTYVRQIGFRGSRLLEGEMVHFETTETIISVPVEGEFLGQLPEFDTPVVGKLLPDARHDSFTRIPSHLCQDFYPVNEETFEEVLHCLTSKEGC